MIDLKEKYRRFREWQQTPHRVAPLSEEEHDCPTCGTHYQGNFCPRCGQSAKIGRYSFKKALLLFIDVWGLGNRGMFRSIRDLILRPGFMIRDYLSGMQMAYFPPFKMFFLLTTLSLLITHGMNIKGINMDEKEKQEIRQDVKPAKNESDLVATANGNSVDKIEVETNMYSQKVDRFVDRLESFQGAYPNIFSLTVLILFSGFFYLQFRKSPTIPGLRYSEFLVALVYITNMLSIYSVVLDFFCMSGLFEMLSWVTAVVALKQMSGFGWMRTIKSTVMALLMVLMSVALSVAVAIIVLKVYYAQ